eukprot:5962763-Pyramimonas_sp.AAC.1
MECHSPLALRRAWPLCSQAFYLSSDKVLIYTAASAATWVEMLDRTLQEDPDHAITMIKHK